MDISFVLAIAFICLIIGFITSRLLLSLQGDDVRVELPPADSKDVLKVWQDDQNGEMKVEFGGRYYQKALDLNTKDRYKLQQILLQLNLWYTPETPGKLADSETSPEQELDENDQARTGFNPLLMLRDAIKADVPKIPEPEVSIVAQIDEILQEKLKDVGYAAAATRLLELPGQGMVVMIGLEKYTEIDEVPNERIRALIRASVAEWEKQEDLEEVK